LNDSFGEHRSSEQGIYGHDYDRRGPLAKHSDVRFQSAMCVSRKSVRSLLTAHGLRATGRQVNYRKRNFIQSGHSEFLKVIAERLANARIL
jgi:hypothetical protein